ncbi:MAG: DegV family protein [Clostridiales bacterium]|nr:DegV family protein [Clostridiales bacterium]
MIKISCDSTADLSPELYERYGIEKLPLYVNIGGREYMDGVDLTSEQLFKLVDETGELPTTAAQSIDDFTKYLNGIREKFPDADEIIHFTISSGFSTTFNVTCLAAQEMKGVYIIDSKNLSSGIGQSVIEACNLAAAGVPAPEIKRIVEEEIIPKVDTSFTLDTLKYLAKGGRCSNVAALGANLLQLKPCIEVVDGRMRVGKKYKGKYNRVVRQYANDRLANIEDIRPDRIFITSAHCKQEYVDAVYEEVSKFNYFKEILITEAACTVSSHCGPNTIGVLFIHK